MNQSRYMQIKLKMIGKCFDGYLLGLSRLKTQKLLEGHGSKIAKDTTGEKIQN